MPGGRDDIDHRGRSMVISGSVAEWEMWTGRCFPDSGPYVIPGALVPITIDREANVGIYLEPNVWMVHHTVPQIG